VQRLMLNAEEVEETVSCCAEQRSAMRRTSAGINGRGASAVCPTMASVGVKRQRSEGERSYPNGHAAMASCVRRFATPGTHCRPIFGRTLMHSQPRAGLPPYEPPNPDSRCINRVN
jgi:hypothetical protein